jgi:hypothetical protein
MDDRQKMRASDADRQEVIDRLRTALDEGRLKMEEYIDRVGHASEKAPRNHLVGWGMPRPGSYPIVSAAAVCLSPDGPQNRWLEP